MKDERKHCNKYAFRLIQLSLALSEFIAHEGKQLKDVKIFSKNVNIYKLVTSVCKIFFFF